jgi:hypothetical protein
MGYFLIFGTVVFAIIGVIWWIVAGHRPPVELGFWWVGYCGFVLWVWIDSCITLWWERSNEMAKDIREIKRRVESIESMIER